MLADELSLSPHHHQPPQLKYCLKKSSVDEGGSDHIRGGRSTRVKFVLGWNEVQLLSGIRIPMTFLCFPGMLLLLHVQSTLVIVPDRVILNLCANYCSRSSHS